MKKCQQNNFFSLQLIAGWIMFMILASCNDNNREHPNPIGLLWNFESGIEGWKGDFVKYPIGGEEYYELLFEHSALPEPLDQEQQALKLSGNNHNSNLFMFVKKKVTGLEPNTVYYLKFTVEFASGLAEEESPGTTGNLGNRIHLAAGAAQIEPLKEIGENNLYGLNIGICNQNLDGEDMVVLGNFSNGTDQPVYALKTVENSKPFHRITNDKGELWIIVGIDSGIDSINTIYYNSIRVDLF